MLFPASTPPDAPDNPPRIGVFWVHRGEVLPQFCPFVKGVDDGQFGNSPFDHVNSWVAIKRRERTRFSGLSALEYQEEPQGRVLYDKRRSAFVCYLDRTVDNPATRAAITTTFALPAITALPSGSWGFQVRVTKRKLGYRVKVTDWRKPATSRWER
jgi:hypothetical protein